MNNELEKYLYKDADAYYIGKDGNEYCQSVHGRSFLRYNKAKEQAKCPSVDIAIVITIIKKFLDSIGIITVENPIISPSDINYEKMQHNHGLNDKRDLVWLKFTKDGYLGVVATSNDINFDVPRNKSDYDKKHKIFNSYNQKFEEHWVYNSSGILLHKLGKEWDESFALVFPLKDIPKGYSRSDVEEAIGNLLISNDIPILDYYSHLY